MQSPRSRCSLINYGPHLVNALTLGHNTQPSEWEHDGAAFSPNLTAALNFQKQKRGGVPRQLLCVRGVENADEANAVIEKLQEEGNQKEPGSLGLAANPMFIAQWHLGNPTGTGIG
ncbi:unnamed protein product [Pleuronectes platessa]|uniref:Uncharacterized protein n=1 Tax=Pleuronectes platessa TaxID=8262 RepID=A0A9N7V4G4_PLEPL|nr:unnamed protein product [Pleuronectes platessa]